jgi:nicotinate dehydrogenase subunit A
VFEARQIGNATVPVLDRAGAPVPTYVLNINDAVREVLSEDPDKPLLFVLRELGLTAAKFGCGLGQCGACNVLVDGNATRSCVLPISHIGARSVTTTEGLGTVDRPHPVQAAFIEEQAAQCGYCTSGLVVTAVALLGKTPRPTEAQVRTALAGNLCRCGTHVRAMRAVMAASGQRD